MTTLGKQYVNVYAKVANAAATSRVLLCKRRKNDWQKGRLNLVGGELSPGEDPVLGGIRELKEEAGIDPLNLGPSNMVMGHIIGSWGIVYCVKIVVSYVSPRETLETDNEEVKWLDWTYIRNNPLLVPNCRVIIPLMSHGVTKWVIQDEGPDWKTTTHDFKISVQSDNKIID